MSTEKYYRSGSKVKGEMKRIKGQGSKGFKRSKVPGEYQLDRGRQSWPRPRPCSTIDQKRPKLQGCRTDL